MNRSSTVSLTPFSDANIDLTYKWVREKELQHLFLMRGEITWEGHQTYFKRVLKDPGQRIYAILYGKRHIGNCGFKNLKAEAGEGELWVYIGETSFRGRGLGRQATGQLLQIGFEELGLESICLHVADYNTAARMMYEKLGFCDVPLTGSGHDWDGRGCGIIRMELKRAR
jgi:RimJ/RimL family protein N-acetyltransferase